MKTLRIASIAGFLRPQTIIGLLLLAVIGGCIYTSYKPVWQFDHLEQNARKVITGPELQAWATRLLDQYPTMQTNNLWMSQLHTNFPQQLRGLAPQVGPVVTINADEDTNRPPYVQLLWGSGFLGAKGFCLGHTNFVMNAGIGRSSMWQPGVYFYRR